MAEPSLRSLRGPARGRFSRQRQVREAIGEARAALQETWGVEKPTTHPSFPWMRRWAFRAMTGLAGLKQRIPAGRRNVLALGRFLPTLAVLLLLVVTVANRGFGVYSAYSAPGEGGEGGVRLLIQDPGAPSRAAAFDFAVAPMTVNQRRPAQAETLPLSDSTLITETSPANVLARSDVVTYTVSAGDTLDSIAEQFGVAPYTVFWTNKLHTPREIEPGLVLTIPPLSGVPHTVQPGETLNAVADLYGVRAGNIVGYPPNNLKYPYKLEPGQEIFVPGGIIEIPDHYVADGERPAPTLVQMPGGEKLSWPTVGEISAPFGWSQVYGGYHDGLDIANDWGTPIWAAADGTVIEAGWGGLGWYVVIDHGNGFRTEYGHMNDRPLVSAGDTVDRGQRIGSMGRTYGRGGYATGVHLHFGVRHHGVYIDPLPLLEH
jgi:murein DD-endopeptidase MepM/ murein hydrolase activator NlpD